MIEQSSPENQNAVSPATKAEILAQIGLALQILNIEDKALAFYKQASSFQTSDILESRIAFLNNKRAKMAPIEKLLEEALKHLAANQFEQARQTLNNVLKLNPDHDQALHILGDIFRRSGQFDQALPFIQQAIMLQPNNAIY